MEKNKICETLFKTIDSLNDGYIKFLEDVCLIESPTEYKKGVDDVGEYFVNKANEKGWLVERCSQEKVGDVLCITMNPDSKGAPVCLSGHMDTVHPIGSFGETPIKYDEEKMYGPGVLDCKGGLVASFLAMDALERIGFKNRPIKLILQSDEENGSRFSEKRTVEYMYEKSKGAVAFLNTELGKRDGYTISLKGICKFRYVVCGKSSHSSVCYTGASAIREAAYKIIKLEEYKDENGITCNCGLIDGGTAENTVPEKCTFTADFRYYTEEEREEILKITKEIAETQFVDGTSCELTMVSYRCSMPRTERNIELFEKIRKIYLENGLGDIEEKESMGGADSADMTQKGIPCLDGFGPIGGDIHKLSEYIYLDSIAFAAKRMALIACMID